VKYSRLKVFGSDIFGSLSLLSKLQSFLLQQQTFLEKCETWMEFLVQTEKKLAVEISGNYQSLMEQQRAHKVGGIIT
jgi:nesprin-1